MLLGFTVGAALPHPVPNATAADIVAAKPPTVKVTSTWADTVIGLSYLAIPLELAFFIVRLPSTTVYQRAVAGLFVCFIMFCGVGHLLDASKAGPSYVLTDRYLTAIISGITALLSPQVFSYSVKAALKAIDDRFMLEKQRDMLTDAQAMTHLGNWELFTKKKPNDEDTTDSDSDIVWIRASDEWFRIFGISVDGHDDNVIPLARYMQLLEEEDVPAIQRSIEGAFRGTPYTIIQRAKREDDKKEIHIRGFGKPLYVGGKITGLRGTAQDITEEVETNRELTKAKEIATIESKHKDIFLATMSHELRTPLTSIIGHVELIEETILSETQQEYVGNAKRAARTLLSLINDILDYSKLIAGVVDLELRAMSIGDILQDVHAIVKDLGREVTIKMDTYSGPIVLGDSVRVRQILLNLVSNAIKFTMPGGFVSVTAQHRSLESGKHEVTFGVRDTGIGMSKSTIEKLFQPFRQADASTNRRFGGTGLGLSIVKRLVDAMEGKINLESYEGVGTTFTVVLTFATVRNLEITDSLPSSPQPSESSVQMNRRLRILLAEDNHVTQKLVCRMLAAHQVEVADNGRIAVDMILQNPAYDVMLCDVNMPILDGLEATKEIRRLPHGRDVYIIGLTANAFKSDRDSCIDAGMNDYLSKPFSKQVLINLISEATQKRAEFIDKRRSAQL